MGQKIDFLKKKILILKFLWNILCIANNEKIIYCNVLEFTFDPCRDLDIAKIQNGCQSIKHIEEGNWGYILTKDSQFNTD